MDSVDIGISADAFIQKEVRSQIELGFRRRNQAVVKEVFQINGDGLSMPKENVSRALQELGCHFDAGELNDLLMTSCTSQDNRLSLEQFQRLVVTQSKLEQWVQSLPLLNIMADAISPLVAGSIDPLRKASQLTSSELEVLQEELFKGLARALKDGIEGLRVSFVSMDLMANQGAAGAAGAKFQVLQMSCGDTNDYHAGIEGRTGTPYIEFGKAMQAEHCTKGGCNEPFTTTNYNITTTPAKEWNYVVRRITPCPDMGHGRRIPDLNMLMKLELVVSAKLSLDEVISVVLYTGPMFQVYNCLLRRWPNKMYEDFSNSMNLFSTTIFVLVSAVQKLSRSATLPDGLVLYRGLGGALDLPSSFYRPDSRGCKGYTEWAFMSTTSKKEVALQYSGVLEGRACATVLVIQVGGVDRGACIEELSQYTSESEYLWLPCSWMEQGGPVGCEITPEGVVRMIPCLVRVNHRSLTTEELVSRKKTTHLSTFKFLIDELRRELAEQIEGSVVGARFERDLSRFVDTNGKWVPEVLWTLDGLVERIVVECCDVLALHDSVATTDYTDESVYRSLEIGMLETMHMAKSKLRYWLEDQASSISILFNKPLRVLHRERLAFLSRNLLMEGPGRVLAAVELCKARGLIVATVDEVNELGESRLIVAAADCRSVEDLRLLVTAGVGVNLADREGCTALHVASTVGHVKGVLTLIELCAEIDPTNTSWGATPLFRAALNGHADCVQALTAAGADPCKVNKLGVTPVWIAAQQNHVECIRALAEAGADINAATSMRGWTALHIAAARGLESSLAVLIELGAALEVRAADEATPLWTAADAGHVGCMRLLLDARADAGTECHGKSALVIAEEKGHTLCAEVIREQAHRSTFV